MIPSALFWIACACLALGGLSALWMAAEMRRHPPHMPIMAAVWPLCALFSGPLLIWFYRRYGRGHHHGHAPFAASVATGTLHCGAGCTLGDLIAESAVLAFPGLLAIFGKGWLFDQPIFAGWVWDFVLAFGFGVVFQYFAIAPMRGLGLRAGLIAALKADAASLTAWQVGMYGTMALAHFVLLPGAGLDAASPVFWFAMQVAMLAGFITAYPVNWALISAGIKERM